MNRHQWVHRVKLQHLRVVLAVAGNASLVKASEQVGLSQPAITKILHEVETGLGAQLFVRTSRGTHCTPMGEVLVAHARLVFARLDKAAEEIHDLSAGLSGRVVIGTLIAGAASVLPLAVARLHRDRPGLRVTIIEGTYDHLIPLLRQGGLDLIVGRLPAQRYRDGLEVESLFEEEIGVVARSAHPVLECGSPTLAELCQWPWILPLPETTLRQIIEAAFQNQNLTLPEAACESVSVVANRRLVLNTDYLCAFPLQVVQPDIDAGLLARIDVKGVPAFGPVGVTRLRDTPLSRAAETLIETLRTVATEAEHPLA